ncbi:hypothetical protein L7F22_031209 [Adiantum nelumboides]|nr:hypothetical protein [Adiantum nelumboides]
MAMMASDLHPMAPQNLDFDTLTISPPAELLQVRRSPVDVIRFVYDSSSSSEDEDGAQDVRKSPFGQMSFMREEDGSPSACTHTRLAGSDSTTSDCGKCSCSSSASRQGTIWSERDILLIEAWERKKKLMLQVEELSSLKDRAEPQLLGRSATCVKPLTDTCQTGKLDRSLSDRGQPKNRVLGSGRGSCLADHDFEELKGAIDLGFRFDESGIANLYATLPALELCHAVAQNLQGSPYDTSSAAGSPAQSFTPSPMSPSWMVGSPGEDDDPEEIKERLRHWAQAVACNTRLSDKLLI